MPVLTNRLRDLRTLREKPMTLEDLAAKTGYAASTIGDVERGTCRAGMKLVAALAKVYRLPVPEMREVCDSCLKDDARAADGAR